MWRRRQAERLVDDEIGDDRRDPGDGEDRVEAEDLLERLEMPISISSTAIGTLNTSQTTRPGWLWVRREKKFDQAIEPA